jgi:hypothetical protein
MNHAERVRAYFRVSASDFMIESYAHGSTRVVDGLVQTRVRFPKKSRQLILESSCSGDEQWEQVVEDTWERGNLALRKDLDHSLGDREIIRM